MNVSVWVYLRGIPYVLLTILLFASFFWAALNIKVDKTELGNTIVWYNHYDENGNLERKFIVIHKKRKTN